MHRDHRDEGARKTKAVAFASTTEELGRSGGGILIPPPPLFFPPGSAETQTQAEFRCAGAEPHFLGRTHTLRTEPAPPGGSSEPTILRNSVSPSDVCALMCLYSLSFSPHRRGYGGTPGSEKLADEEWPDREYAAQPDLEAQRSRSGGGLLPHVAAAAAVAAAGVGAFLLRHRVAEGASAVAGAMGARASEMMAARAADRSRGSAAREGKAEETRRQRAQADAARRERAAARAEQKKRADLVRALYNHSIPCVFSRICSDVLPRYECSAAAEAWCQRRGDEIAPTTQAKAAQREAEAAAASLVAEQRAIAEHAAAAKRAAAERKQRALADATAAAKAAASPASPAPPPRPAPAAPARAPLGDVTNTVAQAAAPPPKGPVRSSPAPVSPLAAASPPAPPPAPVRAKVQPPLAPEAAPAPLRRPAEYLSGLEGGAHALVEVRWTPHVSLGRG